MILEAMKVGWIGIWMSLYWDFQLNETAHLKLSPSAMLNLLFWQKKGGSDSSGWGLPEGALHINKHPAWTPEYLETINIFFSEWDRKKQCLGGLQWQGGSQAEKGNPNAKCWKIVDFMGILEILGFWVHFFICGQNYTLEWFSEAGSGPIRSAVTFYFYIDVRIFFNFFYR